MDRTTSHSHRNSLAFELVYKIKVNFVIFL
jgi:hypothetical protein